MFIQQSMYPGTCCTHWSGLVTSLKTQPGSVTARESITSAWDRLHGAEVTRTERSEPDKEPLLQALQRSLQRLSPGWALGQQAERKSMEVFRKHVGVVLRDVI